MISVEPISAASALSAPVRCAGVLGRDVGGGHPVGLGRGRGRRPEQAGHGREEGLRLAFVGVFGFGLAGALRLGVLAAPAASAPAAVPSAPQATRTARFRIEDRMRETYLNSGGAAALYLDEGAW